MPRKRGPRSESGNGSFSASVAQAAKIASPAPRQNSETSLASPGPRPGFTLLVRAALPGLVRPGSRGDSRPGHSSLASRASKGSTHRPRLAPPPLRAAPKLQRLLWAAATRSRLHSPRSGRSRGQISESSGPRSSYLRSQALGLALLTESRDLARRRAAARLHSLRQDRGQALHALLGPRPDITHLAQADGQASLASRACGPPGRGKARLHLPWTAALVSSGFTRLPRATIRFYSQASRRSGSGCSQTSFTYPCHAE